MTRSEVLALIVKRFNNEYFDHSEYSASLLLEDLEKAGMAPPLISVPTKAIFYGKEINVGNITSLRVWEPEDDERKGSKASFESNHVCANPDCSGYDPRK
jgi:hypothetical protein